MMSYKHALSDAVEILRLYSIAKSYYIMWSSKVNCYDQYFAKTKFVHTSLSGIAPEHSNRSALFFLIALTQKKKKIFPKYLKLT